MRVRRLASRPGRRFQTGRRSDDAVAQPLHGEADCEHIAELVDEALRVRGSVKKRDDADQKKGRRQSRQSRCAHHPNDGRKPEPSPGVLAEPQSRNVDQSGAKQHQAPEQNTFRRVHPREGAERPQHGQNASRQRREAKQLADLGQGPGRDRRHGWRCLKKRRLPVHAKPRPVREALMPISVIPVADRLNRTQRRGKRCR